jgi:hypothetical protein
MSKLIKVSDNFIKAFQLFNIVDVSDILKELSPTETYLLLIKCLDEHDDYNPFVIQNFKNYLDIISGIYDFLDKNETINPILLELIEITGDKYVNTSDIRDNEGILVRKLNTREIREYKLKILKI